jgi:hypothetical protein
VISNVPEDTAVDSRRVLLVVSAVGLVAVPLARRLRQPRQATAGGPSVSVQPPVDYPENGYPTPDHVPWAAEPEAEPTEDYAQAFVTATSSAASLPDWPALHEATEEDEEEQQQEPQRQQEPQPHEQERPEPPALRPLPSWTERPAPLLVAQEPPVFVRVEPRRPRHRKRRRWVTRHLPIWTSVVLCTIAALVVIIVAPAAFHPFSGLWKQLVHGFGL